MVWEVQPYNFWWKKEQKFYSSYWSQIDSIQWLWNSYNAESYQSIFDVINKSFKIQSFTAAFEISKRFNDLTPISSKFLWKIWVQIFPTQYLSCLDISHILTNAFSWQTFWIPEILPTKLLAYYHFAYHILRPLDILPTFLEKKYCRMQALFTSRFLAFCQVSF